MAPDEKVKMCIFGGRTHIEEITDESIHIVHIHCLLILFIAKALTNDQTVLKRNQ